MPKLQKNISRRSFLKTIATGVATKSVFPGFSYGTHKSTRPNIVFIFADDLGYADLGSYGQKNIKTPNLDQMAAQGMRFTQHYSGSTVCAPSRCALLTGLHTGHTRIKGNDDVLLEPQDITISKILRDNGYTTACIGKWGVGHPVPPGDPQKNGFDYFFGYLSMWHAHNYYPEFLWRNDQKVALRNKVVRPQNFYQADQINLVGHAIEKVDYAHDFFTEEALTFIKKNQNESFLLYLPYNIPHANNEMAKDFPSMGMEVPEYGIYEKEEWSEDRKGHAAMVSRMDRDVGRIFETLNQLNIDRNTIVFFSSDNGPHPDCKGRVPCHDGNGPFRGWKEQLYEGGIRVPLIVRWPGKIAAGSKTDHISANWDVFPTLTELTGSPSPQNIDGISFVPTLFGKNEKQKQHKYLYWQFKRDHILKALRMGSWKGVKLAPDRQLELYNLDVDIGETTNVADQYPNIVGKIEKYMEGAQTPL
jgi:arylsulfatase A-like enzyme